ncbi:MAG TPA: PQQ-binding-like beta-propeller repeat protein, partial [Pirellulales bacterium]|nr:PQQ-binding-like beta-propeller repeat protein [Pirellulales bacterium]
MKRLLANVLLLSVVCFSIKGMACGENWPRFRGPNGAGQSDATGIPTLWDNADFNWKVRLPGEGHSSPVVWDDRVFVTSADPDNATLHVEARQTKDGEIVWKRQFV